MSLAGTLPFHAQDGSGPREVAPTSRPSAIDPDILARMRDRYRPAPEVQEAIDALACELEDLEGHPWAGTYYYGDHLGLNADLRITPSGFAYTRHGCLGLYDQQYGSVEVFGDTLVLEPVHRDGRSHPDHIGSDPPLPAILIPVERPEGCFLVRPHEVAALDDYLRGLPSPPTWDEEEFFRRQAR